jgi:uncharacterized protein YeaO (DUF488 family)
MSRRAERIRLKRAYEPPAEDDGTRILVERLWPRGMSKAEAAIDLWLKDLAPSPELRKWYGHDLARWDEFRSRYEKELHANTNALRDLNQRLTEGPVTFVFAAKDPEHCSALVLKEYVERG